VPSCDLAGQVQPAATLLRRLRRISDHCNTIILNASAGDLTGNWDSAARTIAAVAAGGSRTDPPELRSPSCVGLAAMVGFRDFAATVRGCVSEPRPMLTK
jgi:hypothetical protein